MLACADNDSSTRFAKKGPALRATTITFSTRKGDDGIAERGVKVVVLCLKLLKATDDFFDSTLLDCDIGAVRTECG
jgi:hypothetical protein